MLPIDYIIFYYLFWVAVAIYLDKENKWSLENFGIGLAFALGAGVVLAVLSVPLELLGIIDLGKTSCVGEGCEGMF